MNLTAPKKLFLCALFLFVPLCIFAQAGMKKTVALVPFWGSDERIIRQFGDELFTGVNRMSDFMPTPVDMNNLPPDVPEGGNPPYICPSPSLIRDNPYALTGELSYEDETELWHLRLYLWQMSDTRLIYSDELAVYDRDGCAMSLPGMLDWLFSWVPRDVQPDTGAQTKVVYFAATEPDKWLYLGASLGGSMRVYSNMPNHYPPYNRNIITLYDNLNLSIHANVQIFSIFGLQLDAIYTNILNEYPLEGWSFTFPLMARASYRNGTLSAAVMAGAYYSLPVEELMGDDARFPYFLDDPALGFTCGALIGTKAGPGYIYIDIRFFGDFKDSTDKYTGQPGYRRNVASACIGYEMGLLKK